MSENRIYIAIDLKSFYASVECRERGLDPLKTNLVVADKSRTEKTICLAVSPSLKSYGIPGRPRLFEVVSKVSEVNRIRKAAAPNGAFAGESFDDAELKNDPSLALDYIVAVPRMAYYVDYSTRIFNVYLKYVAPEDIHTYSIDEVFMDVTNYLKVYDMTARELTMTIINDVLETTGITATAGIGTNLYLCKVAMDIVAKHIEPDVNGVRIAELDEMSYRRLLWEHRPLTDFWRVGRGYSKKLEANGIYTMGDIARCSLGKPGDFYNEELLYKLFGINAELLIDHAWGYEPCTISEIKAYKPENSSICSGQVLQHAYSVDKAELVVKEMADIMALDLVEKGLVTDQIVLTVGYDSESSVGYSGEIKEDRYGRSVPKHAHGTKNLDRFTSSSQIIVSAVTELYREIINNALSVRRITVTANHVFDENDPKASKDHGQLDFFRDFGDEKIKHEREEAELAREKRRQQAILDIKHKFGKNAILKGLSLEDGATAKSRNSQIGGHKA